jgi:hypothetical protein
VGVGARLRSAGGNLRGILLGEGAILIPLAALVACLPRLVQGISCGHDFEFHLISWMETQRAWSEGILYPHWAQSPNWGAGEPRFVFYPPISWMAGALIGLVVGWKWAAAVFTYLCLTANGFTTRALARSFLPGPAATLAGVIATATPYALFTAYERTAFSELAAAALVPLLLLHALRPKEGEGFPSLLPGACWLALILAAIWLTNAPAGVMASYLLAFAAAVAAWLQRSWRPVLRAAMAVPVGLGLAAVYLVPAAWEQRWIAIGQALDVGMRVADSWLFARHASPDMQLHDEVLHAASILLLGTALAAALGLTIAWRMRRLTARGLEMARSSWIPLALLIPIIFMLQFPISGPLWMLPKMQFLQFPWRWLVVLDIPLAVFLAAATPLGSRRARWIASIAWAALLLTCVGMASRSFFQVCDEEDDVGNQIEVFHEGSGVEGTDEYAPAGADNTLVASTLPDACLVNDPTRDLGVGKNGVEPVWDAEQGSCDQVFTARLWQTEHKALDIDSDHDGFLVMRERRYPAWRVTVNGKPAAMGAAREDGLMVVPVEAGRSTIDMQWMTTPDELWGRALSGASAVVFAVLAWIGWAWAAWAQRRRLVHLSS